MFEYNSKVVISTSDIIH